jgi:hypothetical protein
VFLGDKSAGSVGISLPIGDNDSLVTVKLKLAAILGDEEALNSMWWIKGASGILPCGTLCGVVNKPSALDASLDVLALHEVDDTLVNISCHELSRCHVRSDTDVWSLADDVARAATGAERTAMEHSTGLKYNPSSLLYCLALRVWVPPSTTHGDPMHIIFSNGVLASDLMLFMRWMREHIGAYFGDVRRFYADNGWQTRRTGQDPLSAISEVREEHSNASLKAGASELLGIFPLLRAFILVVYGAASPEPQVQAMLLLFRICDEVKLLIRGMVGARAKQSALRLRTLVSQYVEAFVRAYGVASVRFKHHQLLHVPESILRLAMMLSCFVLERKNFSAKVALQFHKRRVTLCRHGVNHMLKNQARMLQCPGWLSEQEVSTPYPELAASLGAHSARVSHSIRWNGVAARNKDVLFLDFERTYLVVVVAGVTFVPSINEGVRFALIVKCCTRISSSGTASVWRVATDASLYSLLDEPFVQAAFVRQASADTIEVLH